MPKILRHSFNRRMVSCCLLSRVRQASRPQAVDHRPFVRRGKIGFVWDTTGPVGSHDEESQRPEVVWVMWRPDGPERGRYALRGAHPRGARMAMKCSVAAATAPYVTYQ
eukprot:scaffold2984_cov452-Prasinococcus_capsulatus_cf.AAC.16